MHAGVPTGDNKGEKEMICNGTAKLLKMVISK